MKIVKYGDKMDYGEDMEQDDSFCGRGKYNGKHFCLDLDTLFFLHAFVKIYIWVSAAILYRQLIMYCSRNLDLNVPHLLLNQ